MQNARPVARWLAFLAGCAFFWSLMFVICPAINRTFPDMQRIARVVDENNLRTGMFFYTDVEVTGAAAMHTSSTVRFMPHGTGRPGG